MRESESVTFEDIMEEKILRNWLWGKEGLSLTGIAIIESALSTFLSLNRPPTMITSDYKHTRVLPLLVCLYVHPNNVLFSVLG